MAAADEPSWPEAEPQPAAPAEPALVEACDGSRRDATQDARMLSCRRWTIAWQQRGAPWGFVAADSYEGVLAERERQLGFARQYARFFEAPLDERYASPSAPICETCEVEAPAGRWGDGQKFGETAAREALAAAESQLATLDAALGEHLPRLTDAARLARDPTAGKAAQAYAQQLRDAMLSLAKLRLALDNAAVLRSEQAAKDAGKAAAAQVKALGTTLAALHGAVGKAVGKAHAGRYHEEGTAPGPDRPYLEVEIDGAEVKATYFLGSASSIWFQGTVELDGSIAGRSLLAPDSGTLTCAQHSEACGYVYIPAVLRFTERPVAEAVSTEAPSPEGKPAKGKAKGAKAKNAKAPKVVQTAELWFQRSNWVMAKPFSR